MNATASLLKKKTSHQKVLSWLIDHYGLSRRQAYRYLQLAQNTPEPLPVPEARIVFTVKLPLSLIQEVRLQAGREHGSIGQWVEQALRMSLNQRQSHG